MKTSSSRIIAAIMLSTALCTHAAHPGDMRWLHEATDTLKAETLISVASAIPGAGARVSAAAKALIGTPYVAGTLEHTPEMTTISFKGFDCTTFVETALAIARTAGDGMKSWHDFAANLENMRYRSGHSDGYASRLHYISDWVLDNTQRGTLSEITATLPGASYEVKTLDFMSTHRDAYPALANDDNAYQQIRSRESGYRNHRYPIVKKTRISPALLQRLQEGDIVAFTSGIDGLDVSHIGIITIVDGEPRLLHASSTAGRVMIEPRSLIDYLKRAKGVTGIRIIRLN